VTIPDTTKEDLVELSEGKVAVITGAASGIGRALARAGAERGLKLALADLDAGALDETTVDLIAGGADAIAVPTDVREPAALDALRDAALEAFGTVHLVCNNAGVAGGGRTWDTPVEMWRWVLDVDLWSVIHGVRAFMPLLVEQGEGHLVNTASIAGLTAMPGLGPYTVAKHGVVALTETLAQEAEGTGVGVSVLCPAFVRTRIHEIERHAPDDLLARRDEIVERDQQLATSPAYGALKAFVETGIDPGDVAAQVLSAVEAGRLHIFTHPDSVEWVRNRFDRILADAEFAGGPAGTEMTDRSAEPQG
jgi:NAD(P)-dependent dehydrogenase (short-subunit alcohol dehydrogenase family)